MTLAEKIRAELQIGPSTAPELGAIMEIDPRKISAYLGQMEERGFVGVFGVIENEEGQASSIYHLTNKGNVAAIDAARREAVRRTFSMHTVPVSSKVQRDKMRPGAPVSGAKNAIKTHKCDLADHPCGGQGGVLQTIILPAHSSMGETA